MPTTCSKYPRACKIYRFYHESDTGKQYIGRLFSSIQCRRADHRRKCKSKKFGKRHTLYKYMTEVGLTGWKMKTLEDFTAESIEHAREVEQKWIDKLKPVLNARNEVKKN